jgi:hypothetical protein
LCSQACVDLRNGGDRSCVEKFQNYLKEYQITIFEDFSGSKIWYEGPASTTENPRTNLDLLFDPVSQHFNTFLSLTGCFSRKYYCRTCKKAYFTKEAHACTRSCKQCMNFPPCPSTEKFIECDQCNRIFGGNLCYMQHKKTFKHDKSVCQLLRYCRNCKSTINTYRLPMLHKSLQVYCKNCRRYLDRNHQC